MRDIDRFYNGFVVLFFFFLSRIWMCTIIFTYVSYCSVMTVVVRSRDEPFLHDEIVSVRDSFSLSRRTVDREEKVKRRENCVCVCFSEGGVSEWR